MNNHSKATEPHRQGQLNSCRINSTSFLPIIMLSLITLLGGLIGAIIYYYLGPQLSRVPATILLVFTLACVVVGIIGLPAGIMSIAFGLSIEIQDNSLLSGTRFRRTHLLFLDEARWVYYPPVHITDTPIGMLIHDYLFCKYGLFIYSSEGQHVRIAPHRFSKQTTQRLVTCLNTKLGPVPDFWINWEGQSATDVIGFFKGECISVGSEQACDIELPYGEKNILELQHDISNDKFQLRNISEGTALTVGITPVPIVLKAKTVNDASTVLDFGMFGFEGNIKFASEQYRFIVYRTGLIYDVF